LVRRMSKNLHVSHTVNANYMTVLSIYYILKK
jgi:hypothetical protein